MTRDDRGAATVEYTGVLWVAVVLVVVLVAAATGIGQQVVTKICQALELSCGAPVDRARALGVSCVLSRGDRSDAFNLSFETVRVDRKDTDQLSVAGDGTAKVVLSQAGGAGLDAALGKAEFEGSRVEGHTVKGKASADARVQVYGETAYVYSFPEAYGGAAAAQRFLDTRRSALGQTADLLNGGLQTTTELAVRAAGGVIGVWQDLTGASAAERAATRRTLGVQTADAVQFGVGVRGDADAAASVPVAGLKGSATVEQKGTVTVSLHDDGPDHVGSSFSGQVSGELAGQLTWNPVLGRTALPVGGTGTLKGTASGSYSVDYDADGSPTKLVVSTEVAGVSGWSGGASTTRRGTTVKPSAGATQGDLTARSLTLDLTDPANRAAFDRVFATASGEAQGYRFATSVPSSADPSAWAGLGQRLGQDGYLSTAVYDTSSGTDATDPDLVLGIEGKVAGTGGGFRKTAGQRTLVSATGQDLRTGEPPHALSTCG